MTRDKKWNRNQKINIETHCILPCGVQYLTGTDSKKPSQNVAPQLMTRLLLEMTLCSSVGATSMM